MSWPPLTGIVATDAQRSELLLRSALFKHSKRPHWRNGVFRLRPQSGAHRPFIGPTAKGRSGSRPCENSGTFSHGPISFAFSSPETVQRRKNYGNLRSARPVGKFCGVLTRPRSRAVGRRPKSDRLRRAEKDVPRRRPVGPLPALYRTSLRTRGSPRYERRSRNQTLRRGRLQTTSSPP
jgi:hypothetical protein